MPGLCDFSQIGSEPRLRAFSMHACQDWGGTVQTYLLSKIVLERCPKGDFVECGCAAGAQLAVMAQAMSDKNDRRTIHAFDSFQGIPHAGPLDDQQPGIPGGAFLMDRKAPLSDRLKTTKISGCPLPDVQKLWDSWKFTDIPIKWHEGWFQHTLPDNDLEAIAFLRLDGDLAESTECCLTWLYDKVLPGGIIYIDDFGLLGCQTALYEFLGSRNLMPDLLVDPSGNKGAVYWIK